ncbi:MAG: hypothetical protein KTR31_40200 [Myxococcales bacterium]|nr:hypothetical protein [Myxococcales bacterium]
MATRRSFTFGSLVLALGAAGTARASDTVAKKKPQLKQVPQRQAQAPAPHDGPPDVGIRATAKRSRSVLKVQLEVVNRQPEAVEVMVARGSMPGAWLVATIDIDGEPFELGRIHEGDRREFMSRMGPIPRFAPLASGERHQMGPYKFAWPEGVPDLPVHLTGGLDTESGVVDINEQVELTAAAKTKRV